MSEPSFQHTGCCNPFDPKPWEDRVLTWTNERFVHEHVPAFLHIPIWMGKKITAAMAKIDTAAAHAPEQLMLSDEHSVWGSELYIHVAKDVPGATMATISGTFRTTVFDGPYSKVGVWMRDVKQAAAKRGETLERVYTSYTTCPRCAKAYGHNYVVLFAKLHEQKSTPA